MTTLPPIYDSFRKSGIRFITNAPDGKFSTNCPECKRLNSLFVELDADGLGFRCRCEGEGCGFSGFERLRPPQAKGDGNGNDAQRVDDIQQRKLEEAQRVFDSDFEDAIEKTKRDDFPEDDFPEDEDEDKCEREREQREREERERQEREKREREEREREEREKREREKRERKPTIAEAAQAYHERGWKPVPISRKTKRPIGKEW